MLTGQTPRPWCYPDRRVLGFGFRVLGSRVYGFKVLGFGD